MRTRAFVLAAALFASPAAAQDTVSVVGTWVGQVQGAAMPDGWSGGEVTFVITDQQGPGFKGYVSYPEGSGKARSDFVGAIAMDGRTVTTADSNGYTTGFLITPDTLEHCYFESGAAAKVVCGRLRRR